MWQVEVFDMEKDETTKVICFDLDDLSSLVDILKKDDNLWLDNVQTNLVMPLEDFKEKIATKEK